MQVVWQEGHRSASGLHLSLSVPGQSRLTGGGHGIDQGPWMGALDLRLHLKAIKEALLQSNVFHRGARRGGGHLHYVILFRLGAEADRASWASLSLDPTTLTITEEKATQKHIRFRLIYGI